MPRLEPGTCARLASSMTIFNVSYVQTEYTLNVSPRRYIFPWSAISVFKRSAKQAIEFTFPIPCHCTGRSILELVEYGKFFSGLDTSPRVFLKLSRRKAEARSLQDPEHLDWVLPRHQTTFDGTVLSPGKRPWERERARTSYPSSAISS